MTNPIPAESDTDVWVVEYNPGSGWRVSAVFTSWEDADKYEDDLRDFIQSDVDEYSPDSIRTRHGGRKSPTKFFETWPPGEE